MSMFYLGWLYTHERCNPEVAKKLGSCGGLRILILQWASRGSGEALVPCLGKLVLLEYRGVSSSW
jgi:hypothetical protein